ncbi:MULTISPECIES: hypothetical protein [Bacteria]|uniref:Uncharacterized protein n=3 Tax=Escherichia coli TaxID=562 RepID=A7ZNK4_ECO24|nr:hypothetical protein [Escherichia coli]ABV17854.1 hypothetical protein EcE24377A_2323 [Escherichia coli O139:H28 str. E24377A]EHS0413631.1 hypothetical protein [Escherichia coli]EIA5685789.1 hypothetical protein [Escherichia coli]EIV0093651.1 hypothetical protein [Escherichia coli]ELD1618645.1 hypothetical protein [Escherichia coli]
MKKIAIYKVVIGAYDSITLDSLKTAESTSSLCFEHFLISDQYIEVPETWTLIQISRKFVSPAVENRYYKMGVPSIFDDYDYSIYLDGNIVINDDLTNLIKKIIIDDHYIYAYPHFKNSTIKEEIENCFVFSRISWYDMLKIKRKLKYNLNEKVGFECGVLIRKKRNKELDDLFKTWFELYFNNIRRDQFYFSIALKKHGLICREIGVNDIRTGKGFFSLHPHKNKISIMNKIYIALKMRIYSKLHNMKGI